MSLGCLGTKPQFVASKLLFARSTPGGVWRFSAGKLCKTRRLLDAAGRIQSQYWCPEEDSNLHALASAST